ncbi:hypothetical protein ABE28_009155 [Peribacillus muralis]|uniref:RNA polymerase sigma factor 70 region 4 type 2 domain-containing protein n=1 Tax=Peribacillus muralis TaxID=264697 RepID=A0A1B3XMR8_9BACI|nr:sigma-70 family RNA polymerase sigma factor [Peribacillus muralis]AOH54518.1 hypothetical protein ABE28_009155 [Peribacillus muralis]
MRQLLIEYKRSLREARKMLKTIDSKLDPSLIDKEDKGLINNIISDLEYAIEWLKSGRNPDARRGIDKNGVYLTDPGVLDILPVQVVYKELSKELPSFERELIEDALCTLSDREKDVFMMIKVEGLTFDNTADLLGVKKSTVQTHLERAEKKINERKIGSLFLVS